MATLSSIDEVSQVLESIAEPTEGPEGADGEGSRGATTHAAPVSKALESSEPRSVNSKGDTSGASGADEQLTKSPASKSRKSSRKSKAAVKPDVGDRKIKKPEAKESTLTAKLAEQEEAARRLKEKAFQDLLARMVTRCQAQRRCLVASRQVEVLRTQKAKEEREAAAKAAEARNVLHKADLSLARNMAKAARGRVGKLKLDAQPSIGWVSLHQLVPAQASWNTDPSANPSEEQFVVKQMRALPAHVRRQQMEQWSRRYALDSNRERQWAKARDEERETQRQESKPRSQRSSREAPKALPRGADLGALTGGVERPHTQEVPRTQNRNPSGQVPKGVPVPSQVARPEMLSTRRAHGSSAPELAPQHSRRVRPPTLRLPRAPYLEELEADPHGIGFAYKGVITSERIDAKPQSRVIKEHRVHFSIGGSGNYLLHVGLRGTSTPLPGSPFKLCVVPGPPHPLSTLIPPENLPLIGYVQTGHETTGASQGAPPRKGCYHHLFTRDKMGNLCKEGGAMEVTCGCVDRPDVESRVTDQQDGSYLLEWFPKEVGRYEVFVKMDGLHVLGSPAPLRMCKSVG